MPTATILASRLLLKPRSSAMGRKNGPMLMRRPTVSKVRMAEAATIFQPKYHRLAEGVFTGESPVGAAPGDRLNSLLVHSTRSIFSWHPGAYTESCGFG